jgi:hypothetical protein
MKPSIAPRAFALLMACAVAGGMPAEVPRRKNILTANSAYPAGAAIAMTLRIDCSMNAYELAENHGARGNTRTTDRQWRIKTAV